MKVLKASGEYEEFSPEKVQASLKRAGVDEKTREAILKRLKTKLFDGISTKEIYSLVFGWLKEKKAPLASRYNLKRAIMELGPSGYPFEHFVAGVLANNGYQTLVGREVKGRCVTHEIDVFAQKNGRLSMIECKFHHKPGVKTNVKTALYVYARFLDIKDSLVLVFGQKRKIDKAWLVTNTKLTTRAIAYCQCVGLRAVGWDFPSSFGLRALVEKSNLHPLTCLSSLSNQEKQRFLAEGIVFCRDLIRSDKLKFFVPQKKIGQVRKEASFISRFRIRS